MYMPFEVTCDKCHANILISENESGIDGGKEKEIAKCPKCNAIVHEGMTNGFFETKLLSEQ